MSRICNLSVGYKVMQFVKYCIVGALNTMVCLGVIFVCKSLVGVNPYLSNILGYAAGLINSFLWNKQWVFRTHGGYSREALRFLAGFALCYVLQLAVVFALNTSPFGKFEVGIFGFVLSGYGIATLLGNVVYTLANYVYNRLVTFR